MHFIIYETRNLINNKIYRGAHKCKSLNDNYLGSGSALQKAIEKYGKQNFSRVVLESCRDMKHMYEREKFWVDENFVMRHDTYNQKVGGFGGYAKHSSETKAKISEARKGKPRSNETIAKMRAAATLRKGTSLSKEAKVKISEAAKKRIGEKNSFFGKKHSSETKEKISKNSKKANMAS